jgi:hypothetical protein
MRRRFATMNQRPRIIDVYRASKPRDCKCDDNLMPNAALTPGNFGELA